VVTETPGYTGRVTPRGVPDVRELEHVSIMKYAVDPEMANNCYLLTSKPDGASLLIDAADGAESLIQLCDGDVDTIVTTHQHWDHHRALAEMVSLTGATTVAGEPDADAIEEQTGVRIAHRVEHGDTVTVGRVTLEVIAIAGHTPGSIALLYDEPGGRPHLFTGDSLFPGGVGATFGDSEAFAQLIDEVETKVFDRLPDETWFYPGHGDDSTLGAERPHLPEWRERGW
jgi:glyoxylase-like metal-dependent hydrolase (beta-lactamase superfamily II)